MKMKHIKYILFKFRAMEDHTRILLCHSGVASLKPFLSGVSVNHERVVGSKKIITRIIISIYYYVIFVGHGIYIIHCTYSMTANYTFSNTTLKYNTYYVGINLIC